MKFVLETANNIIVHSYEKGSVSLTGLNPDNLEPFSDTLDKWDIENHLGIFRQSIVIKTNGDIQVWDPVNHAEFIPEHFIGFTKDKPEIILLGTGQYLHFPPQDCLAVLQKHNLGYEVMDTAAACRTFNVLVAEGREVILAMVMIE